MTDPSAIAAIIEQYEKHGWKLRRVLLPREAIDELSETAIFGDAEVRPSGQGGLWFSRRTQPDREAWELRRVSASPFAIVEVIPDGHTDQEREEALAHAEARMFDTSRPKETSH